MLTKGKVFGEILAFVYSIEWQKRGLPHVHILIWLLEKIRPSDIDKIISAEIPDPNIDEILHNLVAKHMIHGPCGIINPSAFCMKHNRCEKQFPKQCISETVHNEKGYPLYRRRSPLNGGFTAEILVRDHDKQIIDNSWVVPYSPLLLKMFQSHINVERCNSVNSIKYIMKYIMKGSDNAIYGLQKVHDNNNNDNNNNIAMRNEVDHFRAARYICSNEGV